MSAARAAALALLVFAAGGRQAGNLQIASERTDIFTCGEDQKISELPLRASSIILAGDGRLYSPCSGNHGPDHREVRENALLITALQSLQARSANPNELLFRAAQARARVRSPLGHLLKPSEELSTTDRMLIGPVVAGCSARVQVRNTSTTLVAADAKRWRPGLLFQMMRSPSVPIRKEAAYGLGVLLSEADAELVTPAIEEMRACVQLENDPEIDGLLLEALGATKFAKEEQRAEAEAFIVTESRTGTAAKTLGAVKGLEVLMRSGPRRQVPEATILRLRELSAFGVRSVAPASALQDRDARIRRLAIMALQRAGDFDPPTMRAAATDADWQVRRLLALQLDLTQLQPANVAAPLAKDDAFQVRYEYVGALGRMIAQGLKCDPLVEYFKDDAPVVAMRAMDVLPAQCSDIDQVLPPLIEWADKLATTTDDNWHVPARAFRALARLKPEEARKRLDGAARHPAWQVRAAAASACPALGAGMLAKRLAADAAPNVQTAALEALAAMKAGVIDEAILIVQYGTDYQVLRTAANVLRGADPDRRDEMSNALLTALRRLTDQETDTSRDPRLAILDRLGETLRKERSAEVAPFTGDYDEDVARTALQIYQRLAPGMTPPVPQKRRYPYQPTDAMLSRAVTDAVIELDSGMVKLKLLPDAAPVTVARFVQLVQQGFYKDRTFHRVVPNFVVQGGSAGANEYVGTSRFMRDEVGPQGWHIRGAVGISTRGRDTGDGQIFIDLVDVPRLDRGYTVFAYVTEGMELVDRLLEGAKIRNITVR